MPPQVAEAAVCGWYRVAERQSVPLRPLLATVAGVCVFARRIVDVERVERQVRWRVERDGDLEVQVGRWLSTGRGGPWTVYDPGAPRS